MEVDMWAVENEEPEMSFRNGYQQGAIEVFCAIERFLDPATREVLQAWIEKDVSMWRAKAMLGHPPNLRVKKITGPKASGGAARGVELKEAGGGRAMGKGAGELLRLLADLTGPASRLLQRLASSEVLAMDKLLFWLGHRSGAERRWIERG